MRNAFRVRSMPRCVILLLTLCAAAPAWSDGVSGSQKRAAEEMLGAIASGNANVIALAIHPTELELLRKRVLDLMRTEADRDESGIRNRLFGPAMPLNDIERLTPANFYAILSRRLSLTGRDYDSVNWLEAVKDSGDLVHVIGRGKLQRDRGNVRVVVLVTLTPWGKDWKAAIPLEVQAQIDDLIAARSPNGTIGVAPPLVATSPAASDANPNNLQPIVQLLKDAEAALTAAKCDEYYSRFMSPNFRRLTSSKAQKSLVTACSNKPEVRDVLIAALRAARESRPRYDYDATRAIYDLKGKGLPFERFVLEQVDKKWYVAE